MEENINSKPAAKKSAPLKKRRLRGAAALRSLKVEPESETVEAEMPDEATEQPTDETTNKRVEKPGPQHAPPTSQELRDAGRSIRDFYQLTELADADVLAAAKGLNDLAALAEKAGHRSLATVLQRFCETVTLEGEARGLIGSTPSAEDLQAALASVARGTTLH